MAGVDNRDVTTLIRCRTLLFDEGLSSVAYAPSGTLYCGGFPGDIGSLCAFFDSSTKTDEETQTNTQTDSNEPDVSYNPPDRETPVLYLTVNLLANDNEAEEMSSKTQHKVITAEPIKPLTDGGDMDAIMRTGCDISTRNVQDLSMETNLLRTTTGVSCLQSNHRGTKLFIGTYGGQGLLVDIVNTKKQVDFTPHQNFCVRNASWSPQGDHLVTVGYDGYCRVFNVTDSSVKEVASYFVMERKELPSLKKPSQWTVAWNHYHNWPYIAVTGLKDVIILRFDVKNSSLSELCRLAGHKETTNTACWSPNGLFLLSADRSVIPEVKVWNVARQHCINTFYNSNSNDLSDKDGNLINSIVWHPNSNKVAVADVDGWLARFCPLKEHDGSSSDSQLAEKEWELFQAKSDYQLGDGVLESFVQDEASEESQNEEKTPTKKSMEEDDDDDEVCPSIRSRRKRVRNPELLNEVPSMPKVTTTVETHLTSHQSSTTATSTSDVTETRISAHNTNEVDHVPHEYNEEEGTGAENVAPAQYPVQEPFQPGSIPKDKATVGMGGTKWRYLAWTPEARVVSIMDTAGNHRIEIAFADINRGSSIRFVDDVGYEIAGIGETGVVFASCEPTEDEPCQLRFRSFHSWSSVDDCTWDIALPQGEIPLNVAVGREWVAASVVVPALETETDTYKLRIWGTSGIELATVSLAGPTISMNAVGPLLGLCLSANGQNQCSIFACPDSRNTTLGTSLIPALKGVFPSGGMDGISGISPHTPLGAFPVHFGTVSAPVQGDRQIKWLGFNPSGLLCLMDDAGVLHALSPANGWLWNPLLDTKSNGKMHDQHFVLGAKDDSLISVLLKQGQAAPRCVPSGKSTPLVTKTPFRLSQSHCFGGAVAALATENKEELGACTIERLNLDTLRWALHMGIRLDTSDSMDTDDADLSGDVSHVGPGGVGYSNGENFCSEIYKREKKLDKRILKQMGNLIKVDAVNAAFQLCAKLVTPKAYDIAVQLATKANHRGLMKRLHAVRVARQTEQNMISGSGGENENLQNNSQELKETKSKLAELEKLVHTLTSHRSFNSPDDNANDPPGTVPSSRSSRHTSYSKRLRENDFEESSNKTSRNLNEGSLSETVSTPPRKHNAVSNPFAQGSVASPSKHFQYDENDRDVFAKFAPSPARIVRNSASRAQDRAKRGLGEHVGSSPARENDWDGDLHAESLVRKSTFSKEARSKKQNDIRAMSHE